MFTRTATSLRHPATLRERIYLAVKHPALVALATFFVFVLLCAWVHSDWPLEVLEEGYLRILHETRGGSFTEMMLLMEAAHDPYVNAALAGGALVFLWMRLWGQLALLLAITLGGGLLTNIAKMFFARERPDVEAIVPHDGFSFPSGHAAGSTLIAVWSIYMVLRFIPSRLWRPMLITSSVAVALAAGFSRIYLGAHYFTDVLGAIFASVAWGCGCIAVYRLLETLAQLRETTPSSPR